MCRHEALSEVGVSLLDGLDDAGVVDDRSLGPVVLADGDLAYAAHMRKQAFRRLADERAAGHADDQLVEGEVGLRIFRNELLGIAVGEGMHVLAQETDSPRSPARRRGAPPCLRGLPIP